MQKPKKNLRYVLLKIDSKYHVHHPWHLIDLLNDGCTHHQSKKIAYEYAQLHKQFWEDIIDITEVD